MSRSDRLFRLADALRRLPPPVTADQLAQVMEVSPRTIYRDIETLRASGAIIDGASGYGYVLIEDTALPPMMFDEEEIEALVLGLREVIQIADPVLRDKAEGAMAKLGAALPPRLAEHMRNTILASRRFQHRPEVHIDVAELRAAARSERAIEIDYADANGALTTRHVWPLAVIYLDSVNTLVAHCRLRMDFRTFRLDRIKDLRVTQTSFRPRRVGLLREFKELHMRTFQPDIRLASDPSRVKTPD